MKKLFTILIICIGCFGLLDAQNIWKPINAQGVILGASADGSLFANHVEDGIARSQDEGETWQIVLGPETGYNFLFSYSMKCFSVSPEGRIFVFNYTQNCVMYSDDNGDTWQQTTQISSCAMPYISGIYASSENTVTIWTSEGEVFWTLDGGTTWDYTIIDVIDECQWITDLIVGENGDVFASVYYFIGSNIGIYHSTLSDMRNWELMAFETIGIKDMEFDPDGNVVCGVDFGGEFSGFEHSTGFYAFWANSIGIADNGIIYKTAINMDGDAVLAYSLDHGEHFYNTVEGLPLSEPIPGGEDGFLSRGSDNHLYFLGNEQYWKSIPNANDIPSFLPFLSEWYYEIQNDNGSVTYQHLECQTDTVIENKRPKVIVRSNTQYDRNEITEVTHEYVYEENGKVYWWNKDLQEFTTLYDLNAEVGDEWEIKVGYESIVMYVDSVGYYENEGERYRMLHVSDENGIFSGDIVCGIGHLTSFFPEKLMNRDKDFRVEGLRCYWMGNELVFKIGDEDCDAIYGELHGVEEMNENGFSVYPNPANGVLVVETCHGASLPTNAEYRIANMMGQTLLQGTINCENQRIDINTLPAGMYFLMVEGETMKFVKR